MVSVVAALALATATLAGCVAEDGPLGPRGVATGPRFDEAASSDSTSTSDSTVTSPDTTAAGDTATDDELESSLNGQLLVCPTAKTESVAAEIGPLGGILELGTTRIAIPADAVPEPTTFVLTIPAGPYLEIEVHAEGIEHYQFQQPVSMTIDYGRCPPGIQRQFRAWYIDSDTKELLEEMGGVTDIDARTHTFETPHLSGYAVSN